MKLSTKIKLYIKHLVKSTKADSIEFRVSTDLDYSEDPEGFPWKHADIIINGKSLFEILREYEISEARRTKTDIELAGKYIGIDPQSLFKILKRGNTDNLSIWQCSVCMSSLCASDLVCKYRITPFTVKLYDFRQQSNPIPFNNQKLHEETIEKSKWNYTSLRPFRFNRMAFFRELGKLPNGS